MSENTDYETLKAERDAAMALISRLVFENAELTDKAASELSNAWLLHRTMMGAQAALFCITQGKLGQAREWLEGTTDEAQLEIPDRMEVNGLQRWFDENMTGLITHAKAVEIIKAEMNATKAAFNKIKAQGIEEFADNWQGKESHSQISEMARRFAASLRSAQ
ncbi:hypothetical protein ACNSO8_24575 [Yersinia sp. LJYL362]|uniref:hypothetical protein n=1 Tax=Yersinia sp. LJYL362 TaxID=3402108 RepID=UPI003AB8E445